MGVHKAAVVYVDQQMEMGEEICAKDRNGDVSYDEFPGISFSGYCDLDVAGAICGDR